MDILNELLQVKNNLQYVKLDEENTESFIEYDNEAQEEKIRREQKNGNSFKTSYDKKDIGEPIQSISAGNEHFEVSKKLEKNRKVSKTKEHKEIRNCKGQMSIKDFIK